MNADGGVASAATPPASEADASTDGGPRANRSDGGGEGEGDTPNADVEIPLTRFCDLYPSTATPPPNPDLTKALPGSVWNAKNACVARAPFWRVSTNELTYGESEAFQYSSVAGTARSTLSFSKAATLTWKTELDYRAKVDFTLGVYLGLDSSCDVALAHLVGTGPKANGRPFQEGVQAGDSSCVSAGSDRCACELAIRLTTEIDNEGYQVLAGNKGVKLASNTEVRFALAGTSMTVNVVEPPRAGRSPVALLEATLEQ